MRRSVAGYWGLNMGCWRCCARLNYAASEAPARGRDCFPRRRLLLARRLPTRLESPGSQDCFGLLNFNERSLWRKKMNRRLLAILLFTCSLSVAAYAQGSGTPSAATRTVTGTVAEVKDDGKALVITDKKGDKHEFKADAKMKMKGGDK